MTTRQQAEEQLLTYLRSRAPERGEITVDFDLLDNKVIDSLGFTEFLFVLEEVRDLPLEVEDVRADDFRSVRAISRNFLGHLPEERERDASDDSANDHATTKLHTTL